MKFKFFAGLALTTLAIAACKVEVDGTGGLGGSGDTTATTGATTGSTKASSVASTSTNVGTTTGVTVTASSSSGGTLCENEATCADCQQCAFAGACSAQVGACGQGTPCDALNTCLNNCPQDNPATMDVNEFFQCACMAEPAACDPTAAPAGTCFGDNPTGVDPFFALIDCLFGQDGMSGECGANADCQN